jgi:endonuclease-3 related protein
MARRLERAFGPQGWWPAETAFEVMVGAVLTQNAAWRNVERAMDNLAREGALEASRLLAIPRPRLEALVRPSGYFRVKAGRLLSLVRWLERRCGGDAGRLSAVPTDALRRELLAVNGVGPETADSILLYALGRPVFVVDAYTRRVLARHGMSREGEPYDSIRLRFERAIRSGDRVCRMNELHAQVVELAKRRCRVEPVCEGCPLAGWGEEAGLSPRRTRRPRRKAGEATAARKRPA